MLVKGKGKTAGSVVVVMTAERNTVVLSEFSAFQGRFEELAKEGKM